MVPDATDSVAAQGGKSCVRCLCGVQCPLSQRGLAASRTCQICHQDVTNATNTTNFDLPRPAQAHTRSADCPSLFGDSKDLEREGLGDFAPQVGKACGRTDLGEGAAGGEVSPALVATGSDAARAARLARWPQRFRWRGAWWLRTTAPRLLSIAN